MGNQGVCGTCSNKFCAVQSKSQTLIGCMLHVEYVPAMPEGAVCPIEHIKSTKYTISGLYTEPVYMEG